MKSFCSDPNFKINLTEHEINLILDKARSILLHSGWNQGFYTSEDGRCCIKEIIRRACTKATPTTKDEWQHYYNVIYKLNNRVGMHIDSWNDKLSKGTEGLLSVLYVLRD